MLSLRRPLLCGVRSGAWMRRVPRVEGRFGQGLRGLCSTSTGITITPRCAEVRERVRPPRHVCTIAPVPTLRVVSPPLGAHSRVCVCVIRAAHHPPQYAARRLAAPPPSLRRAWRMLWIPILIRHVRPQRARGGRQVWVVVWASLVGAGADVSRGGALLHLSSLPSAPTLTPSRAIGTPSFVLSPSFEREMRGLTLYRQAESRDEIRSAKLPF